MISWYSAFMALNHRVQGRDRSTEGQGHHPCKAGSTDQGCGLQWAFLTLASARKGTCRTAIRNGAILRWRRINRSRAEPTGAPRNFAAKWLCNSKSNREDAPPPPWSYLILVDTKGNWIKIPHFGRYQGRMFFFLKNGSKWWKSLTFSGNPSWCSEFFLQKTTKNQHIP